MDKKTWMAMKVQLGTREKQTVPLKPCPICRQPIVAVKPAFQDKQKYCSAKCSGKARTLANRERRGV